MKNNLIKNGYSFNREFCGQLKKRIIVRFLGDFVSHHGNMSDALLSAENHYKKHYKNPYKKPPKTNESF